MNSKNKAEAKIELQAVVLRVGAWQCCLNCLSWDGNRCDKFKAVPPPHIIVNGCRDHEDEIPF
jgi:hypothetical protein